jgi:hypothetical protein
MSFNICRGTLGSLGMFGGGQIKPCGAGRMLALRCSVMLTMISCLWRSCLAIHRAREMQWRHSNLHKSAAEEIEPGCFDGKTYRCPMHREFEVADSVLQTPKLMGASTAEWKTALSRAKDKTAPGKRPRILTYHF